MNSKTGFKQTEIGEIPEDWHKITLGELATFQRGHDLPKKKREKGEFPIIASNGIVGYHNKCKAKGPGVTIGRSGNLGEPYYIEGDFWPLNTTLYIKEFHDSYPKFVYYFLKILNLKRFNAGSAVPTLNRNHIHPIEVIVPKNIEEQQSIAKILFSLDDKIQLNQQMNKTLESIGQVLFKHWFIDFEFPDEDGNPYKSSGGEMVHSEELGKEIPNGWKTGIIEDLCISITNGGTPRRMENKYWDNGTIPWYKTGELFDGPLLDSEEHITEEGLNNSACRFWGPNTILIALYASPTVGRLGILKTKGTSNQACSGLVAKDEIGYVYIFYSLLFKRNEFNSIAVGSAQQNISQQIVKNTKVLMPDKIILMKFQKLMEPLFDKKTLLISEEATLARIRDSLLPKLMSGKIRVKVPETEAAV